MIKYNLSTIIFATIFVIILVAPLAYLNAAGTAIENPLKSGTFEEILERIIRVLVVTAMPVYAIVIGMGVYYTITGAENPGNRKKARNIFFYGTIGFLIILLSAGIASIIQSLIS